MSFSSLSFLLFFLPPALFLYYLVPRRFRPARNLVLLAVSVLFYACGGLRSLPVVAVSILINYLGGLLMEGSRTPGGRRRVCALAVVLQLILLGWFKYSVFAAENLRPLLPDLPRPEVVLPLGVSFFTFHGLSYVFDVYRGRAEAQKNFGKLALYILLFPKLVSGPIVPYASAAGEVEDRRETLEDFAGGGVRFCFGLAKKALLASALGDIADAAFSLPAESLSVSFAWLGMAAYTLQIYFDFSGYSDMAIGLGRMFGFHFPENFNYPYTARSITDFWRRWHISLTSWFRSYVYIPLGGNRCARWKHIRNLAAVWLLTGLWHGAAWTFVFWGLWYLVILLGEKFLWGGALGRAPSAFGHLYAMLLVMMGWVFFRADSLPYAAGYLGALFGLGRQALTDGQTVYYLLENWPELLAALIAMLPVARSLRGALEKRPAGPVSAFLLTWGPKGAALILLALSYGKLVSGSVSPFVYFQF